jgi:serine/threonine protein kinase
VKPLCIGERL